MLLQQGHSLYKSRVNNFQYSYISNAGKKNDSIKIEMQAAKRTA